MMKKRVRGSRGNEEVHRERVPVQEVHMEKLPQEDTAQFTTKDKSYSNQRG